MNNAASRIIVALDCDGEQARELAYQLKGHASWLKVGMTLYYAEGPRIVREFVEQGFKVFVDLKLHDIPHQVRGAAQRIAEAGANMFTVHATGGAAMMHAALEGVEAGCGQKDGTHSPTYGGEGDEDKSPLLAHTRPLILAITVLTSMDAPALAQTGVTRPIPEQVQALARQALDAGLDGVVASPQEAAQLRALLGPIAAIVTPGVRPAGASLDDQSRVATPAAPPLPSTRLQPHWPSEPSVLLLALPIVWSNPCSLVEPAYPQGCATG